VNYAHGFPDKSDTDVPRLRFTFLTLPATLPGVATGGNAAQGRAIKRARERLRWTQDELAERMGVSTKSIDNWENGRTSPRSAIGALEEVLGISLDEDAQLDRSPSDTEADIWNLQGLSEDEKAWLIAWLRTRRAMGPGSGGPALPRAQGE
jgi:transcriptional regulator with XRE-family HTH domain